MTESPRNHQNSQNYTRPDSGCREATEYLGYQSSCLECPFDDCVFKVPLKKQLGHKRNREIRERVRKGEDIGKLARAFGITKRQVKRIASGK